MAIRIDKETFVKWIESIGCDYCTQGFYHIEPDGLYFRWRSDIRGVITKHDDLVLELIINGD